MSHPRYNACRDMSVYGCYEDGSLVEQMVIPLSRLRRVPDTVPMRIASLSEPVSIAMQAARRGRPVRGEQQQLLDSFTDGDGPSLVIEATGVPDSLLNAVHVVANAGRIVTAGISVREVALPMNLLPTKELDLLGSRNSLDLIDDSLALIGRHVETMSSLVTHRFAFDDLASAFATLRSPDEFVGKVAIDLPETP